MVDFEEIFFDSDEEKLSGVIANSSQKPTVLFLHGAGTSDKTRTRYLMEKLGEKNISCFGFDFSGHGKSTGSMEKSSLQKRCNEAASAMQFMETGKSLTVCGSSMSGHIAIKLLQTFPNIGTIILFAPAIYDRQALTVAFDDGFAEIIRKPDSWKNSEIFSLLENFEGKLLIFIGENDQVIPKGVIEKVDKHSSKTKQKETVVIPECTHMIHGFINEKPELIAQVSQKMLEFI